jgi:threonyl-tRNA synthetase
VTNASRAFWRADVTKEPLQRVYAVTFPDKALLKDYQHRERGESGAVKRVVTRQSIR